MDLELLGSIVAQKLGTKFLDHDAHDEAHTQRASLPAPFSHPYLSPSSRQVDIAKVAPHRPAQVFLDIFDCAVHILQLLPLRILDVLRFVRGQ